MIIEVPGDLKALYRHWEKHSQYDFKFEANNIKLNTNILDKIEEFAKERMLVWYKKENNYLKPYTNDTILAKNRFCNIYRELDRQTIDIHKHLKKYINDFDLWLLNLCLCRFICNYKTIVQIGDLNFDYENNLKVYKKLKDLGSPKYGTAYIFPISLILKSDYKNRENFFCFYLPLVIKKVSMVIQKFNNISVLEALDIILPVFGFKFKFHWTEILIDIAYQYPEKIDLFKEFYIGPGAIPTLNSIKINNIDDQDILKVCIATKFSEFPYLHFNNKPIFFSAENWEGIFCEFRKYTNLKLGNGRVRKYN